MLKNKSKNQAGATDSLQSGLQSRETTPCRPRTRSCTGRRVRSTFFFSFGSAILLVLLTSRERRPGARSTALKQHGGASRDHTVSGDPQPAGGTFCSRRRVRHRSIAATRHREQRRRPAEGPQGLLLRGRIGRRNEIGRASCRERVSLTV